MGAIPLLGTMIGELTSRIKLHQTRMTVRQALHHPRLVRKQLEVPLVMNTLDPLLIGRDENIARLVIPDHFISRTHAAIVKEDEHYYIKDLFSKNGTFVNEKRLAPGAKSDQPLKNGDKIRFNLVEFEFIDPQDDH